MGLWKNIGKVDSGKLQVSWMIAFFYLMGRNRLTKQLQYDVLAGYLSLSMFFRHSLENNDKSRIIRDFVLIILYPLVN